MKFHKILLLISIIFLIGCEPYKANKSTKLNLKPEKKYNNIGFALIYNQSLNVKKLDNRSLQIFHKNLKRKSFVKITNPLNNKSLIAEVKSNNVKFSRFYNSIISSRIAETLELNINEPYIEIILISKNSTFVAKKAKTFEEEKEVADKAPVDGISISDLSKNKKKIKKYKKKDNFSYIIKLADFYYENSAKMMQKRIKEELNLNNSRIIKISNTNYRVYFGPYDNLKSLKKAFDDINPLNFENIEIIKL